MEKLKAGDIFVAYCSELEYVYLCSGGSFLLSKINGLEEYDYPLTTLLCMYLGDNVCEEYYSHIKMQVNNPINEKEYYISVYDKQNTLKAFDNIVDRGKNFKNLDEFILSYPLIVEPNNIYNANRYYVCESSNEENTIKLMTNLNEVAKAKYLESKNRYLSSEYDKAYVEDMCINFQKRKKI